MLNKLQAKLTDLSRLISPCGTILLTSIVTNMISCNQTLSTILTNQLCQDIEPDASQRAIDLENTCIILAPLIPWSIASSVSLATVSAPTSSLFAACYLYLLILWHLFMRSIWPKIRP